MKRVLDEQLKYRRAKGMHTYLKHLQHLDALCLLHADAELRIYLSRSACFTGQENTPPSGIGVLAQPTVAASTAQEASQAGGSSLVEIEGAEGWVHLEGAAGQRAMAPLRSSEAGDIPIPHVSMDLLSHCDKC